jgi:hypothetical protein
MLVGQMIVSCIGGYFESCILSVGRKLGESLLKAGDICKWKSNKDRFLHVGVGGQKRFLQPSNSQRAFTK